jgi:hypothetical protein
MKKKRTAIKSRKQYPKEAQNTLNSAIPGRKACRMYNREPELDLSIGAAGSKSYFKPESGCLQ